MKRRYRAVLAAAALAFVIPASGCAALLSAQQTHTYIYSAGDGAWADFESYDINARGILLIANDEGTEAQLFYTIVNTTDRPAQYEISVGDYTHSGTIDPGGKVVQNPQDPNFEGEPAIVTGYNAVTGEQVDVKLTVNGDTRTVRTQVLDSSHWYYADLQPTGGATDGATDAATDNAEETPADQATETPTEEATQNANG